MFEKRIKNFLMNEPGKKLNDDSNPYYMPSNAKYWFSGTFG